jgi:hypothetical protein
MIRRFNRFELKYLVTSAQRDLLLPDIAARMVIDREGSQTGHYRVTSLYYDTDDFAFARSKREGIKYRRKVRVRIYGDRTEPDGEAMLEIKQRINRTVQKRRVAHPLPEALAIC